MMPASILMPGLLAATSTPPCNVDPPSQCAWYNSSLSPVERRERLLAAMTIDEKFDILLQQGVDRLHVTADGFNEAAHGIAWTGRATVFPCSMGMAATWDVPLVREMGRTRGWPSTGASRATRSPSSRPTSTSCATSDGTGPRRRTARTRR